MTYPIQFIEDNLVFNKKGECFAYFELVPYNYSFLSVEQKYQVHDNFRQLMAQNEDGKIHALQIATQSSIRTIQEESKKHVKGNLKELAYGIMDNQTEALVQTVGENQVNYRFFVGFKLMITDQELTLQRLKEGAVNGFYDFLNSVKPYLFNDFISKSHTEIERYSRLEKLLENKISRRFKIRRLNKNDFGYILDHLYAQVHTTYEAYEFHLPKRYTEKEVLIKEYDLLKPTYCKIKQKQRCLEIQNEETLKPTYVAYLPMSAVLSDWDEIGSEVFYYQQQQFNFPVDISMNLEIIKNKKALGIVRNKKKGLKDQDNHAGQSHNETATNVLEALDEVDELETTLDQTKEPMYKLSYVVRVTADHEEELKRRCDAIKDFYDGFNIKLSRPLGDMVGLHEEFIPSGKRHLTDYIQYVRANFLASLGFGSIQRIGERNGIYIGYNRETEQNIYIQPWLAAQGVQNSVTNALSMAFLGSLGGGKSFVNNLLVYYSVLFGAQAVIVDPKSERGKWKETLPEIAHEINIVNLTSDDENRGMLDPYVILKEPKDSENLAIDILTFMTGISSRDGEKFPVLVEAIQKVTQSEERGLLKVIDELEKENTTVSNRIASHIKSFKNFDLGSLLFGDGNVRNTISFDKQLNIIQVADLVLPDSETEFKDYTNKELLSVAMLLVISTFSLEFIHSDRSKFKIVDLDEAWTFLQVSQGKALSNKLVRAGRSMNAGVYFVTQNADDLQDEKMKNNIGLKFAFKSTDPIEIKKTLRFFGLDENDENNHKLLKKLENGECLFQDLYGQVSIIKVHPVFESLFHAFDTRPPQETEEEEVNLNE